MSSNVVLEGIDGSNPLGFLAAVGTLRSMSLAQPDWMPRLFWLRADAWRPVLAFERNRSRTDVVSALALFLRNPPGREAFRLGNNLNIPRAEFRKAAQVAVAGATAENRAWADFLCAFASDGIANDKGLIEDTALRTMSGSGHQHFLGFIRTLIKDVTAEHIEKALFAQWKYDDRVENHTMRWDPLDDIRYALRWRNPSGDPARKERGSMWGANRLAIEAMPLIGTIPENGTLKTTGFSGTGSRSTFWTWPIWSVPASPDVVRSVLALRELQSKLVKRSVLERMGVAEVYRSQRITVGKYRNFTPGVPA
ncbi:MAG TPA: hypothetical protein VF193_07455 [Steroidobacter sp.]